MPLPTVIALGLVGLLILLLPSLIALVKRSKDRWAIVAINVAFFYSFSVWVPLLIWSFTGSQDVGLLDRLRRSKREAVLASGLILVTTLAALAGLVTAWTFLT
jgi:hypothetical protein